MVPENILWAFYSAFDYQQKYDRAVGEKAALPKDVYYKNTKGEWVKVTAVFACIDDARRNYRLNDAKYLGPVLADTKGEIERGAKYPPPTVEKSVAEAQRKEAIRKKLWKSRMSGSPGTITVKKMPVGEFQVRPKPFYSFYDDDGYHY